jgi:hypothetical protein
MRYKADMKTPILLLALVASVSSAFAVPTVYIYPIASTKILADKTVAMTTTAGLEIYVNCARQTFDDSTHDYVSGFSNKEECERFVADVKEGAGKGVEIELNGMALLLRKKF